MKVRLISRGTVEAYALYNAQCRASLQDWLSKMKFADWEEPGDIRETFCTADLLGNGSSRVVFDIGGNNYRIICKCWFGVACVHVYIKWIGTHAEYSRLCRKGLQYVVDDF